MRPYLPMAIAAVLVVFGLAAVVFLTPSLAPPQAKLQTEIADAVAQAQAMLAAYSPTDADLLRRFDAAVTTQPSTASQPSTTLDSQVKDTLERRQSLISDALALIQKAIQTRIEAGEASVGGDSSIAATQLQAILTIEQAQIFRRQAEFHWRRAGRARAQVREFLGHWIDLDTQIRSLQATLSGQGILPTKAARVSGASEVATSESEPTAPPADQAKGTKVGQLLGRLLGGNRTASAPAALAEPETQPAAEIAQLAPTSRPARVAAPPDCTLQMSLEQVLARQTQSPAQRIADLKLCRAQVESRLAEAQKTADSLAPQIKQLHQRIDATKAQADAAQKKMLALEHDGVDATDPNALPRFTKDYNEASTAYRRALRTISILTFGSATEPQLSPEEKEMLLEPLIPLDADLQKDHRGVTALDADLAALIGKVDSAGKPVPGLIETQKKLLAQIDRQIEHLSKQQKDLQTFVARQETSRSKLAGQLTEAAKTAVAEAVQAYQFESQSLDLLTNQGHAAAQRAQRAAEGVVRAASEKAGENPENLRYDMISKDKTAVGHGKTLIADVDAAATMTLAERANQLDRHALMLKEIEPTGIPAASLLTSPAGDPAPAAWATSSSAATAEAEKARADGVKAGLAAIESYRQADNDTKRLWTLHTEIAAMEYLLANLTASPDSEKHLAQARREYDLATRDRRDRPEVQPLRAVYENLAQSK